MASKLHLIRRTAWVRRSALCAMLTVLYAATAAAQQPVPLVRLGVDLKRTSVSGLSSGAYMAGQFQIAHAEIVTGVGLVAGGPYGCAETGVFLFPRVTRALFQCMDIRIGQPDPTQLMQLAARLEARNRIGPLSKVKPDRVFIFSGTEDDTVSPVVVKAAVVFYRKIGVAPENIAFVDDIAASHAFLTEGDGGECNVEGPPYIVPCGYDLAGKMLKFLHPNLVEPETGEFEGRVIRFDQKEFASSFREDGLHPAGFVFVPQSCEVQPGCQVHIAFHGCRQTQEDVGEAFVRDTGYLRWAAANRMVVLFPQIQASRNNPRGCWDWWGYTDARYLSRSGLQISAVRAMLDRLAERR